jgi:hypothetical protein
MNPIKSFLYLGAAAGLLAVLSCAWLAWQYCAEQVPGLRDFVRETGRRGWLACLAAGAFLLLVALLAYYWGEHLCKKWFAKSRPGRQL